MNVLKPKKLSKGGVIGLISPASAPVDSGRLENSINYLEKLGYRVVIGENVGKSNGYLAGTDEERLSDLHSMFRNKKIEAVFCLRGGYGSGRLLDKLDFNLIKKNPKIFVGYSDITVLQMALFAKLQMVTFAGPMPAVDMWSDVSPYTEEIFWRAITSEKKIGKINNFQDEKLFTLIKGKAEGKILGGNLALFISLLGTPLFPDVKDKILLFEEVGEAPYRVDRMLNQLKLAKVFDKAKGVILGQFVDCYADGTKPTINLNEVIADYFNKMKIPVLYNFHHGHIKNNITVPFGTIVKIDSKKPSFEIMENAVI